MTAKKYRYVPFFEWSEEGIQRALLKLMEKHGIPDYPKDVLDYYIIEDTLDGWLCNLKRLKEKGEGYLFLVYPAGMIEWSHPYIPDVLPWYIIFGILRELILNPEEVINRIRVQKEIDRENKKRIEKEEEEETNRIFPKQTTLEYIRNLEKKYHVTIKFEEDEEFDDYDNAKSSEICNRMISIPFPLAEKMASDPAYAAKYEGMIAIEVLREFLQNPGEVIGEIRYLKEFYDVTNAVWKKPTTQKYIKSLEQKYGVHIILENDEEFDKDKSDTDGDFNISIPFQIADKMASNPIFAVKYENWIEEESRKKQKKDVTGEFYNTSYGLRIQENGEMSFWGNMVKDNDEDRVVFEFMIPDKEEKYLDLFMVEEAHNWSKEEFIEKYQEFTLVAKDHIIMRWATNYGKDMLLFELEGLLARNYPLVCKKEETKTIYRILLPKSAIYNHSGIEFNEDGKLLRTRFHIVNQYTDCKIIKMKDQIMKNIR